MALFRSYLFAPGNQEKILHKVFAAGSDAVVLDLEDAVPHREKEEARRMVARILQHHPTDSEPPAFVRINSIETPQWKEDLAAAIGPRLRGVRIPKTESAETVLRIEEEISLREAAGGVEPGTIELVCTVETAKGILAAGEIAACRRVRNLTFGAADFVQDIGSDPGDQNLETLFARAQLVLVSRAADIDPPVAAAYTRITDEAGLRRHCEADRRLGFFGRSAIHPRQIPIIHEAFTPSPEAIAWAKGIVQTFDRGAAEGVGATVTDEGHFVDLSVVRKARAVLAVALHSEENGTEE